MWIICHAITLIFELFGLFIIWVGLVGFTTNEDSTPKWFNVIFDTFFGIWDGDD